MARLAPPHKMDARDRDHVELSVIIPCLNAAETLARRIESVRAVAASENISLEVIVADRGSHDGSVSVARRQRTSGHGSHGTDRLRS